MLLGQIEDEISRCCMFDLQLVEDLVQSLVGGFEQVNMGKAAIAFEGIPINRYTELLIELEAMGFNVDPTLFVDQLRPGLFKKKVANMFELKIMWHKKTKHSRMEVKLISGDCLEIEPQQYITKTGYQVIMANTPDKNVFLAACGPQVPKTRWKRWLSASGIPDLAQSISAESAMQETTQDPGPC